jgi:hypothetical protein
MIAPVSPAWPVNVAVGKGCWAAAGGALQTGKALQCTLRAFVEKLFRRVAAAGICP